MDKITAGLGRVSTSMQRDKNTSIPLQKELILKEAKQRNLDNVRFYIEDGVSSYAKTRPEYDRLMQDVEDGKVSTVIVYKIDRLERNVRGFLETIDKFNAAGVHFVSITENIDTTTPQGRFFLTLMMAFSEMERSATVERVSDFMNGKAQKGEYCGGPVPFGFKVENKQLIIEEIEASIYRKMFAKMKETLNFWAVMEWLNQSGHRIRGKLFTRQTVQRLLQSPLYKGYISFGKRPGGGKSIDRKLVPVYKGNHKAIIPAAEFDELQLLIKSCGFKAPPKRKYFYLLSGLLYCGHCGTRMGGVQQRRESNSGVKLHRYYRCHGLSTKGSLSCKSQNYKCELIEAEVLKDSIAKAKITFEQDEIDSGETKEDARQNELEQIRKDKSSIKNRIDVAIDLNLSGGLAKEALTKKLAALQVKYDGLIGQEAKLLLHSEDRQKIKRETHLKDILANPKKIFNQKPEVLHNVLLELIEKITIQPDGDMEIKYYEL